ncbi:hypothetical protein ACN47E_005735 [Coniothyrium glycines]
MARDRDDRGTRYHYIDEFDDDRDRRHRRRHHRAREYDDEPSAVRRERRERRRADDIRREAELDIDDLRARRASYYDRPDDERPRDQHRMARVDKERPRTSHREVRKDATRRSKPRQIVVEDREDDYVYGRPKSTPVVEEVLVRRSSARRRSEEGASSNRTAYTPVSGSGSASLRREDVPKLSRSISTRETSRTSKPSLRRTSTIKTPAPAVAPIARSQSVKDAARRSTGGIFSIFRPPMPRTPSNKDIPRVDCLVCMNDELPITKTVKLACGHRMCHSCLKRQFTLSVQDPQHMPPRCCTKEHIPLKYADRLFDDKFKILWNKKYQEYTTENRLYCPARGCGQWIKPSRIRIDRVSNRKYAKCGHCGTKVCVLCNSKFHTRRECPRDEGSNRFEEMAKEQGWQKCYNCKAVVELKEGCNHMTCRCNAQFCMVCAAPWKTCSCPWFNYQHIPDEDRLHEMQVPYTRHHDTIEVIEMPEQPSPPLVRRTSTRTRQRSERERNTERTDHAMAARLQQQLHLNPTASNLESNREDPMVQTYGLGNAGAHHMNDSYAIRHLPTSAARTTARQTSAPRQSFFRRVVQTPAPRPTPPACASAMAGLSKDGRKIGANRVGTWLTHIQVDSEAINTAPRNVEVDDWRCDGTMIGID